MFFLPRKDLHGLTALSISVTPPVLPLSLPGHSIAQTQWLWCFHASCAWGVFDLQSFVYAIAMLLSQEGQGRIQGVHNSVCLCNLTMNELLSRWAFIQSMALIPICLGISPALPKQSSYFPACLLQLHRIWSCHHVPAFLCFVGCERNRSACLAVLQVGQLSQPREPRAPTGQAGLCRLPAVSLTLCCGVTMLCHCTAHILQNCSTQWGTQHITYQLLHFLITTAFFGLEGFLGVDCQITAESCDLWYQAEGVWGFTTWLLYSMVPANASPRVFWILQATLHCCAFGNTWIKSTGVSK